MGTADIFVKEFFPASGIRTDCLFENHLYKKHIQNSPSADAQQHIMLPLMYAENECRREKLRDSMGTLQDGNGFEMCIRDRPAEAVSGLHDDTDPGDADHAVCDHE